MTVICGQLLLLLAPLSASTATYQGKWIDRSTIEINGVKYIDNKTSDNTHHFQENGNDDKSKCVDVIKEFNNGDITKATSAHLVKWESYSPRIPGLGSVDATCVEKSTDTVNIDPASLANANKPPGANPSGQNEEDTCESHGVMAWLMCPVIELLDGTFNWLDTQIQALLEINQDAYTSPKLREAWGAMRNIAYIILVPMMLVMVIGTALGIELFSAYTVKKAMPRMVAAVIFMTLSWQICTFIIGFFNVVGAGALGLMTAPFGAALQGDVTLSRLFEVSYGGSVGQFAGIGAFLLLINNISGLMGIIMSYLGLAVLVMIITFLVLTLRQMFVLALLVVSPLAILAWIFPGNDKLWKSWWGLFSKLLMMFPLIMVLIGVGRVFAFIIGNTPGGTLQGSLLNPILKIVAYTIPYALIPLTFKFAGGVFATVTGMVNDRSKGVFDRMGKKRQQKYERTGRQVLQKRADWQNRLQTAASQNRPGARGAMQSFALGKLSRGVGGYNVMAADSARRAAVQKELNDQINTGRDDEIRGLTVNKAAATLQNGLMRLHTNPDGTETRQYKTLGGAWVSEAAVDDGYRRWGDDSYAQQTALSYEMRKAATDEEVQGIGERYQDLAVGGWGMSGNMATGTLKGAGFENQGTHLEFKHMKLDGSLDHEAFVKEAYEKKGSYPLSQMSGHTIKQLRNSHAAAVASGDTETQRRVASVAETFMTRYGAGDGMMDDGSGNMVPAPTGARGPAAPAYQTNSHGAASVAEEVRKLAVDTGVYRRDVHTTPGTLPVSPGPVGPIPPIDPHH